MAGNKSPLQPCSEIAQFFAQANERFYELLDEYVAVPQDGLLKKLVGCKNKVLAATNAIEGMCLTTAEEDIAILRHELRTAVAVLNGIQLLGHAEKEHQGLELLRRGKQSVDTAIDMLNRASEKLPPVNREEFLKTYNEWLCRIEE